VGAAQVFGQVPGHGLGPGTQRDDALEVAGVVFLVGNLPAEAVHVALAGPPAGGVPGRDYAVDAVRGEEAVVDALAQAVGVDRIPEIVVGVGVVLTARRGGHADLVGRLEVVQDLPPVAVVAGAAAMAFVNDNQIKKIAGVFAIETRPALIAGNGLVGGEIHFAALHGFAMLDFPARVAERREGPGHGIVDQDIAVGKVENARPAVPARAVPARRPQFPADLESDERLAGARRHG